MSSDRGSRFAWPALLLLLLLLLLLNVSPCKAYTSRMPAAAGVHEEVVVVVVVVVPAMWTSDGLGATD